MKRGDLVRLKIGGQSMTIMAVDGDDAECMWFEHGERVVTTFPVASLEPVDSFDFCVSVGRPYFE
jgi:uncharacterized protein YodC (DUF2158 family)